MKIPTYIINLKSRPERKANVLRQFEGKPEFSVTVVEAIHNKIGLLGLWETMKYILKDIVLKNDELILICQDDHQFTEDYSYEILKQSIGEAKALDADILLGGVSWFQSTFQGSPLLFWTEKFSGLQFAIIFRKFYNPLLNLELDGFDAVDYRISAFTDKKWFIFPFISTQADYGYSDITEKNNKPERQTVLFQHSINSMKTFLRIFNYFSNRSAIIQNNFVDIEKVVIPTFIICPNDRSNQSTGIEKEFKNKNEFEITIIETESTPASLGIWKTIRKIVSIAKKNNEDLIVICQDNHLFTENYSKKRFIESILTGHKLGVDLLVGGTPGGFSHLLPVAKEMYWLGSFSGLPFMVLYDKLFRHILEEPFDDSSHACDILSQVATNKVSLYPFISCEEDKEYSDSNSSFPLKENYKQAEKRFMRLTKNFENDRKIITNNTILFNSL
jgi:hypothetical protein